MNGIFVNALKSPRQIYAEEGILFFPQLFEDEELVQLREACERIYEKFMHDLETTAPEKVGGAHVMRHLNDPRYHDENGEDWKLIMEIVADPRCVGPVEQIFGGPSLFYTTSLFFNPREGREEGQWHRDQQFTLKDEEEVRHFFDEMQRTHEAALTGIQLQIALVDTEDIEYVPFSAGRYDSPQEYYVRCADDRTHNKEGGMPNAMRVHQRPGDAVAFNPAGLHRGRYYSEVPRRTLMLTYTPYDVRTDSYFSQQPWMLEPNHLDGLSPRARVYFEEFIAAYRDFWVSK